MIKYQPSLQHLLKEWDGLISIGNDLKQRKNSYDALDLDLFKNEK